MVVCKFFLQGSCRYGNKCWNEHPSGGNQGYSATAQRQLFGGRRGGGGGGGQNQNPFKWVAPDNQQQQQQNRNANNTQQLSPADTVKALAAEVTQAWEGGNMWPFSCLGFEKEMPSLPGFTDISMEELRFDAYEALKQGNIQPYIQKVEHAFEQQNIQKQELKNPSMSVKQKLIAFVDNCRRKKTTGTEGNVSLFSDSSGLFGGATTGSDLFGTSSTQSSSQTSTGLFGGSSSTFGQSGLFGQSASQSGLGQTGAQSNLFGQSGTQSLFGQSSTHTAFGATSQPSPFAATSQTTVTGFGQSNQPATFNQVNQPSAPLFGQSSQPSTFGQSNFGQTSQTTGLFGKPSKEGDGSKPPVFGASSFSSPGPFGAASLGTFGSSTSAQPTPGIKTLSSQLPSSGLSTTGQTPEQGPCGIYTSADKLTPEELEQFQAQTFTLGKIPTKPPPKELCF